MDGERKVVYRTSEEAYSHSYRGQAYNSASMLDGMKTASGISTANARGPPVEGEVRADAGVDGAPMQGNINYGNVHGVEGGAKTGAGIKELAMRYVKLGRKPLDLGVGHHWVVRVEDEEENGCWYEIQKNTDKKNEIRKSHTKVPFSGACMFGAEIVGKTTKTDDGIEDFNKGWLHKNPTYTVFGENSQTFGIELIDWLTDQKYRISSEIEGGTTAGNASQGIHAHAHGGQAYAGASMGDIKAGAGFFTGGLKGPTVEAEARSNAGLYAGFDATLLKCELNVGNLAGVEAGLNVKTGAGIRNGNAEAHLLGFGGAVGTDGVEISTPIGGVKLPVLAAPVNLIGKLLKK